MRNYLISITNVVASVVFIPEVLPPKLPIIVRIEKNNQFRKVFFPFFGEQTVSQQQIINSGDWKHASGNFARADRSYISFAIALATYYSP